MIVKNIISKNYIIIENDIDYNSKILYYKYGINLNKSTKDVVQSLKDKIKKYY